MKVSKLFLVLLLGILTMSFVQARPIVAEVLKVRGAVTQLAPGNLSARKIRKGDRLREDTSVVTGRGSFVRIRFIDSSQMNIGPNSKARIVQVRKSDGGIISLLKGKIRTSVLKSDSTKKNKFFIKTRSAAMGVRGTDFQIIYNPRNKITSLVTFTGEVAMVKTSVTHDLLEEDIKKGSVETKATSEYKAIRADDNQVKIKEIAKKKEDVLSELIKMLESKDVVIVKRGQYSGSIEAISKVSKPVKISPVQLNILYKNIDMVIKKKGEKVKVAKIGKIKDRKFMLKAARQEAPEEGFFDKNTGDFAPKAGGVIDLETGIYIAPSAASKFDKKTGVYVASDIGVVDQETGQYIAPKGLRLDAKKGFVLKGSSSKKKKQLLVMRKTMNDTISKEVILAESKEELTEKFSIYSAQELFSKDTLLVSLLPQSETITILDDSYTKRAEQRFESDSGKAFKLSWEHSTKESWQPITSLKISSINFKNNTGLIQASRSLIEMGLGVRYILTNRWRLQGNAYLDQKFFFSHEKNSTNAVVSATLQKITLPKISLSIMGDIIRSGNGRMDLTGALDFNLNLSKKAGELKADTGFGLKGKLDLRYWLSTRSFTVLGVWANFEKYDVSNPIFSSSQKRTKGGLEFTFGRTF